MDLQKMIDRLCEVRDSIPANCLPTDVQLFDAKGNEFMVESIDVQVYEDEDDAPVTIQIMEFK